MANLLLGAPVCEALNKQSKATIQALKNQGVAPTLCVLRVGEKEDDISYERGILKRSAEVGLEVQRVLLPENVTQAALLRHIEAINKDDAIHGLLMFRPLPAQLDDATIRAAIDPRKDMDGITDASLAGVFSGNGIGYAPCTAEACIALLEHYGIDVKGKRVIVVGRSLVIGKPVAMLLLQKHATVTICHTRTVDMPTVCQDADILVVAAGKAGLVDASYVHSGQTVIDVGIHVNAAGKLCGDVDFESVEPVVQAITPVPRGVGTVTTSILIQHVIQAAQAMQSCK